MEDTEAPVLAEEVSAGLAVAAALAAAVLRAAGKISYTGEFY